jgi:hypothetical protein
MNITKAKSLKIGDSVYCPTDLGEGAYKATVIQDSRICTQYTARPATLNISGYIYENPAVRVKPYGRQTA